MAQDLLNVDKTAKPLDAAPQPPQSHFSDTTTDPGSPASPVRVYRITGRCTNCWRGGLEFRRWLPRQSWPLSKADTLRMFTELTGIVGE